VGRGSRLAATSEGRKEPVSTRYQGRECVLRVATFSEHSGVLWSCRVQQRSLAGSPMTLYSDRVG